MMEAIIIDDEQYCIDSLQEKLKKYTDVLRIVATEKNPLKMLSVIEENKADIVFLDINLGPFSAFDLIEKINSPLPKIVFTTAYDQFAVKAFKFNAIDYLLKPVDAEELEQTIEKIKQLERPWPAVEQLKETIHQLKDTPSKFTKIALPTLHGFELVELEKLVRMEAASNYTHFFMEDGKKITISKTLKEYESLLEPEGFVRIHQSHLINLHFIKSFIKGKQPQIILQDGTQLDVSSTRKDYFLDKFKKNFRL